MNILTLQVDLYYTMRSPYCYLCTPQIKQLVATRDVHMNLKPVYPLAVSDPTFFERVNPLWPPYVAKDTARIARRLNIPFHWPRPDPIVQDRETRAVAREQPHIHRLTRLAQLAAEQGLGLEYVVAVSGLLFSPDVDGWNTGEHLYNVLAQIGVELPVMERQVASDQQRLDAAIAANRQDQLAAGHWGAPLFVHDGEIFFGQDRIEDLVWHLENNGVGKA